MVDSLCLPRAQVKCLGRWGRFSWRNLEEALGTRVLGRGTASLELLVTRGRCLIVVAGV